MILTIREQEVAHWTAEGKTCKEIGIILGIAFNEQRDNGLANTATRNTGDTRL